MTCYEELRARGLIAQVTNEEEISKMINEGKAVFYSLADGHVRTIINQGLEHIQE